MLQAQLVALLQRWRQRLRGRSGLSPEPFLSLDGEQENRRIIRAVYQSLLAKAIVLDCPRMPAQTPAEYETRIPQALAVAEGTWLHTLTGHYVQARYADQPPSAGQVEEAKEAWAQIETQQRIETATD